MREHIVTHFRPHAPGLEAFFGSLEALLLDYLWRVDQASARECLTMIHATGQCLSYGAVKTVLDRLAAKQILTRVPLEQSYLYRPACSRNAFEAQAVAEIMGRLIDDYGAVVAASLERMHPADL